MTACQRVFQSIHIGSQLGCVNDDAVLSTYDVVVVQTVDLVVLRSERPVLLFDDLTQLIRDVDGACEEGSVIMDGWMDGWMEV
jgi:hypothetical protein